MHATVFSGSILGVNGFTVEVEVDISRGIPSFSIVGLPNTAVRESRERVTAAIKNSSCEFPLERITVNLAPADIKKEGAAFDLAIAMGIVIASSGDRRDDLVAGLRKTRTIFLGELALDGSIRWVRGVLPILLHARTRRFERAIIPAANFAESLVVGGIEVFGCRRLAEVIALVRGKHGPGGASGDLDGTVLGGIAHKPARQCRKITEAPGAGVGDGVDSVDFSDVAGQESVKRALLVAAAGGHHVLMTGPPGAGKTMLARRFPSILPPLDERAALETTKIYSIAGMLNGGGYVTRSPFRAPHHSASDAGLIGGGSIPRPGEVTLAHNGVLFLDELPEFRRHVLETLREPLEEGRITISRAKNTITFPARFQLVAAMNPCPCGFYGSLDRGCRCTPLQVQRYRSKISGPLLDRISVHVCVLPVKIDAFKRGEGAEKSGSMTARVERAREMQRRRIGDDAPSVLNARLPERHLRVLCALDGEADSLLLRAQRQLRVSARGRSHIIRVARTIADLDGRRKIATHHVAEAIQYRVRDLGE